MKRVYLAGPITGLTYDEGNAWRVDAHAQLTEAGIEAYSPMRAKEYLRSEGVLQGSYTEGLFSSSRNIMTRDYDDCSKADLILCNLLGATKPSLGTVMEIAWAYSHRIPLVIIMEKEGNPHEHPMIAEAMGFRVDNVDHGIYIAKRVLLP